VRPGRDHSEFPQQHGGALAREAPIDPPPPKPGIARMGAEDHVLRERELRDQPFGDPVVRDEADRPGHFEPPTDRSSRPATARRSFALSIPLDGRHAEDLAACTTSDA